MPHATKAEALDTPSQVPNIPTPVISYRSYDVTPLAGLVQPLSVVEKSLGETTLHYVLERLNGLYDSAKVMDKVSAHVIFFNIFFGPIKFSFLNKLVFIFVYISSVFD